MNFDFLSYIVQFDRPRPGDIDGLFLCLLADDGHISRRGSGAQVLSDPAAMMALCP